MLKMACVRRRKLAHELTAMIEHHVFPCETRFAEIGHLPPFSPFSTLAYARARAALGDEPHVFLLRGSGRLEAACIGFLSRGRFTARLDIPSFPKLAEPAELGAALEAFCRAERVWDLELGTFGSEGATFPRIGTEVARRPRWEFVLDLAQELAPSSLASNHRRNVNRARKSGLIVVARRDPAAAASHAEATNASLSRRQKRGESVITSGDAGAIAALLQHGAAELFQATKDDRVLSSMLLLMSPRVAYYHSAGTTSEGMHLGASPYLITEVAARLRARGVAEFNLGGAEPENAGLYRFKSGFGPTIRALEAASFVCARPFQRMLRSFARDMMSKAASLVTWVIALGS